MHEATFSVREPPGNCRALGSDSMQVQIDDEENHKSTCPDFNLLTYHLLRTTVFCAR